MTFKARWAGPCATCHEWIAAGQQVRFATDTATKVSHSNCGQAWINRNAKKIEKARRRRT